MRIKREHVIGQIQFRKPLYILLIRFEDRLCIRLNFNTFSQHLIPFLAHAVIFINYPSRPKSKLITYWHFVGSDFLLITLNSKKKKIIEVTKLSETGAAFLNVRQFPYFSSFFSFKKQTYNFHVFHKQFRG